MTDNTQTPDGFLEGACLCLAVAYRFALPLTIFQYCHCNRCQTVSGAAHTANIFIPSVQFQWLRGEEKIKIYKLPEAKHFSSCFCQDCGSSMPWQTADGRNYLVPAGGVNDLAERPKQSIFWSSRPNWYVPPLVLPRFDTLPARKKAPD